MMNNPNTTASTVDESAEARTDAGAREDGSEPASDASSRRGGILAALRRSPLVGADLDLARRHEETRVIDL
ncbi:hypothetical protein [Methylobacterium platani]|uniref:hypothetical protein n=1 Tax=Methylobacterium platani TaxID=427683 RepID=UPI0009E5A0FE|nr:hypothetical protein [Methylobacterium platani]